MLTTIFLDYLEVIGKKMIISSKKIKKCSQIGPRATFGLAKVFSQNYYNVNLLSVHREWEGLKLEENMKIIYLCSIIKRMPT